MKWETVRLGDIANFSNGINFDKSAYAKGVMLIGVSDFGDKFYPDYSKLSQVKKDIVRENDYLKDGDIVFVRSNGNKELVGRCMLIRNPPTAITYSGFCIRARLKDTSTYNPVFFTYHFKGIDFRRAMSGTAVGANIQNLSQTRLSNYGVLIPDIKTQQHIANILSAYDQLIESNQKQIKLLEEAAQRLYKEWFVDFRFPGYENVPIVDGVPEGWAKAPLRRIINYEIGGGWGEEAPTEKCEKPAYVIRGTDMYGMIHGDMYGIPYRYHEMNNLNARELIDGDIIFEVSGGSKTEGVARTLLIRQSLLEAFHSPVICASFCKLIRLEGKEYVQYLYDTFKYLRDSGKTTEFDKRSASSIVNYRWKDFLSQQEVLLPCAEVLEQYNALTEILYNEIIVRSKQIEVEKKSRDRLLPKLMSGELEV